MDIIGHNLTPGQMLAVEFLVGGMRPSNVAKSLKISRQTLWNWRQMPEFHAEMEAEIKEMRQAMRLRLQSLAYNALKNIDNSMNSYEHQNIKSALEVLKMLSLDSHMAPTVYAQPAIPTERSDEGSATDRRSLTCVRDDNNTVSLCEDSNPNQP